MKAHQQTDTREGEGGSRLETICAAQQTPHTKYTLASIMGPSKYSLLDLGNTTIPLVCLFFSGTIMAPFISLYFPNREFKFLIVHNQALSLLTSYYRANRIRTLASLISVVITTKHPPLTPSIHCLHTKHEQGENNINISVISCTPSEFTLHHSSHSNMSHSHR